MTRSTIRIAICAPKSEIGERIGALQVGMTLGKHRQGVGPTHYQCDDKYLSEHEAAWQCGGDNRTIACAADYCNLRSSESSKDMRDVSGDMPLNI